MQEHNNHPLGAFWSISAPCTSVELKLQVQSLEIVPNVIDDTLLQGKLIHNMYLQT